VLDWLLAGVDSLVSRFVAFLGKPGRAVCTAMWLLASVDAFVDSGMGLAAEQLIAVTTAVAFGAIFGRSF